MNPPPSWDNALSMGGWDLRFATVLAIGISAHGAAVVVDPNSDCTDINIDIYHLDEQGNWFEGSSGNGTSGWSAGLAFTCGQAGPGSEVLIRHSGNEHTVTTQASGWWIFTVDTPEFTPGTLPTRVR